METGSAGMSAGKDPHAPTERYRRPSRLLNFTAGVFLALVAMEGVVRLVYSVTFSLEPGYGYIRRTVWYRLEGNGLSHWTTNDLRRHEPPDPRKPSILVLGDSFTEALMVHDDEVYTGWLEKDLHASGIDVQVLNLGFSGTSSADYVAYAAIYQRLFSQSWTIIQLRSSDLTFDAWEPGKTHFLRAQGDQDLKVEGGPPHFQEVRDNPWKQRLRSIPSMIVYHGLGRFGEFWDGALAEPPLFRAGSVDGNMPGSGAQTDESYPIEQEMDLMTRSYGGRVTYLFLPHFDPQRPLTPESSVERRFEEHCTRNDLSCVNLHRAFPEFVKHGRSPYGFPNTAYNSGHMNAEGHRAIAAELFPVLSRLHTLGLL
jgi:lysophospholipase L1-like esterase